MRSQPSRMPLSRGCRLLPSCDHSGVVLSCERYRVFTTYLRWRQADCLILLTSASCYAPRTVQRTPSTIALIFPSALMLFVFTPLIRPFRWSRLLWTYLVPIIPLVLLFDGVVSCLRTYRPQELCEIIKKLSGIEYQWEVGEHSKGSRRSPITYLIGYPNALVT